MQDELIQMLRRANNDCWLRLEAIKDRTHSDEGKSEILCDQSKAERLLCEVKKIIEKY